MNGIQKSILEGVRQKIPVPQSREVCLRCLRSKNTCYCLEIQSIHSRFQFVLLQHPLEHRNKIGTARMTHHSLVNSKLFVGVFFDNHPEVQALVKDPKNQCVILYPGPQAFNISLEEPKTTQSRFQVGKNPLIFVIDGTWACARKMVRQSQLLSSLPQICFTPQVGSQYQIRRQPHPRCLSTLEAVHHLLQILDPEVPANSLLFAFQKMVTRQLSYYSCGNLSLT